MQRAGLDDVRRIVRREVDRIARRPGRPGVVVVPEELLRRSCGGPAEVGGSQRSFAAKCERLLLHLSGPCWRSEKAVKGL